MTQVFPYLPGLGWPIERSSAQFDTTTQIAMSGKKTTFANRVQGVYVYTLTVEGLDSGGFNGALVNNSWQTLVGFINQCYGSWLIFNFFDFNDKLATTQAFGTGDGVTTAFQLARVIGGWADNIFAPLNVSTPTLVPSKLGGQVYAPNNLLKDSNTFNTAFWATGGSPAFTTGVSDPFGGTSATTMTAGAANSLILQNFSITGNFVNSIWVRRRTGSGTIEITKPNEQVTVIVPTATWTRFSLASADNSGAANFGVEIVTSGDAVDIYGAQLEQSTLTTPGPNITTLSTSNPGQPQIFVNGVLQDPSTYTIGATGVVTFNTAPAGGAALTWTGNYYWPCNFDEDSIAMSKMYLGTWSAKSIKFTTRIF